MYKKIAFLMIGSVLSSAAISQEVTLKVSHFLPALSPVQQRVIQPWCDDMKEASNGRISCQIYPSMQLGGTPGQLFDQVRNGVADVVWTAPGYAAGRFPKIEAMELPFRVKDSLSGSLATWSFYNQYAQDEFKDYKVLALHIGGGMGFFTAKKPVNTLEDLKGLKLRAAGRVAAQTMEALGITPVAMPPVQMTESIAKGVVDGALGALDLVNSARVDEVVDYYAGPADGLAHPATAVLGLFMNQKKYQSLPDDLKKIVDEKSGEALVRLFGQVWNEETDGAIKILNEKGKKLVFWNAEQLQPLVDATAVVEKNWIEAMNKNGHDGSALAQASKALGAENGQ